LAAIVSWSGTGWLAAILRSGTALTAATFVGTWADQSAPGSGILLTLISSTAFSRFVGCAGDEVVTCALSDWTWSLLLPASLAFLMLSLGKNWPAGSKLVGRSDHDNGDPDPACALSSGASVSKLALPFLVASAGSIAGCSAAFGATRMLWERLHGGGSCCRWIEALLLTPREASVAASCLAASFVGGSVNFLATASAIVAADPLSPRGVVTSLASVDLIVMAVYFGALGAVLPSKRFRKLFGDEEEEANVTRFASRPTLLEGSGVVITARVETTGSKRKKLWTKPLRTDVVAGVLASFLSLNIVQLARLIERSWLPSCQEQRVP
jgi:hypothetical protein